MPDHKKNAASFAGLRSIGLAFSLFMVLVIYDILIGGSIAALLKSDGFTGLDQRINNVHQLAYGLVVAGALLWYYLRERNFLPVLALGILFVGFVEDSLFYLLIPVFNPLIRIITGGADYQVAGGEFMPQQVSGWSGWVARMAVDQNMAFSRGEIFIINGIAVVLAFTLLLRYVRER